jgi:hypothetical protein
MADALEVVVLTYEAVCRAGHQEAEWTVDEGRKVFYALSTRCQPRAYRFVGDLRTPVISAVERWLASGENWDNPDGEPRPEPEWVQHDRELLAKVRRLSAAGACALLDAIRRRVVNPRPDESLEFELARSGLRFAR